MIDSNEALLRIVQTSSERVKQISESIDNAPPRQIEGLLKSLDEECSTLSAALHRLSAMLDSIPQPKGTERAVPEHDGGKLLALAERVILGASGAQCGDCGGVLPWVTQKVD